MSFTAYISEQEKSDRYAAYCALVNRKKMEGVTLTKTKERFLKVHETNPLFIPLHRLNSQNPERINELPSSVRRNLGDTEAIDLSDDDEGVYIPNRHTPVRSAVGVHVRGQLKQHHNGKVVGHQRSALSVYQERTGEPFSFGTSTANIPPTTEQKVNEIFLF